MDSTVDRLRASIRAREALPPPARRSEIRKQAGLTLQEVADAVGVTFGAIWNWENGIRQPRGQHLANYIEALGVMAEAA
jgi:transcriptional regulator with XRE-family HTH domain